MFEDFISWLDNNNILFKDFFMQEVVIQYFSEVYKSDYAKEAICMNLGKR